MGTAKALYAYEAQDADELSMNIGDIVEIISEGIRRPRIFGKEKKMQVNSFVLLCVFVAMTRSLWMVARSAQR